MSRKLLICSKSPWLPAVRREHALAELAAAAGWSVTFVERSDDIRAVRRDGLLGWLARVPSAPAWRPSGRISVIARSTVIPGHKYVTAERVNAVALRRVLSRIEPDVVVCTFPWDWRAVQGAQSTRLVFDLADEWSRLMPHRAHRVRQIYGEVESSADSIVVADTGSSSLFPGRRPHVVRNAIPARYVGEAALRPAPRSMVYVGTLSHRFDAVLIREVLRELEDWTLELVGPCLYPGLRDRPHPELLELLESPRITWHGPMDRDDAIGFIDRASVALIPNRRDHTAGQDSMKLYDYSARGRPVVATSAVTMPPSASGLMVRFADDAGGFASKVVEAATDSEQLAVVRREYAAANTWEARWPLWEAVLDRGGDSI